MTPRVCTYGTKTLSQYELIMAIDYQSTLCIEKKSSSKAHVYTHKFYEPMNTFGKTNIDSYNMFGMSDEASVYVY